MMRDVFIGFLFLRLLALLTLLTAGAAMLGLSALSRDSDTAGVVLLVAAVLLAAATGWLVLAHRAWTRSREV